MAQAAPPQQLPLQFLVGKWVGQGKGSFPTIESFEYSEAMIFKRVGKQLMYSHETTIAQATRHCEAGMWRALPQGRVEALISQISGLSEVDEGQCVEEKGNFVISLQSKHLARTSTAKPPYVTQIERVFTYQTKDDTLSYVVKMATTNTPELTLHLIASFKRE